MKLSKLLRFNDWWTYKKPYFLGICYGTLSLYTFNIFEHFIHILLLIGALIVGASYVSVINDLTDLDSDLQSGKKNRMVGLDPIVGQLILALIILAGLTSCFFLFSEDILSLSLYLLPWISFSLYSIPPFRLKNRGFLGILADALGSQVFPSLLMISSLSFYLNQPLNWYWFLAVGFWSFAYGLRGILTHQYIDKQNDEVANVNTYVRHISFSYLKKIEAIIFISENIALTCILILLSKLAVVFSFIAYLIIMAIRWKRYDNRIVIITTPQNSCYQIALADFYTLFFPLSLLISASIYDPKNLYILAGHILLFPKQLLILFRDLLIFIKYPKA